MHHCWMRARRRPKPCRCASGQFGAENVWRGTLLTHTGSCLSPCLRPTRPSVGGEDVVCHLSLKLRSFPPHILGTGTTRIRGKRSSSHQLLIHRRGKSSGHEPRLWEYKFNFLTVNKTGSIMLSFLLTLPSPLPRPLLLPLDLYSK